MKSVRQDVVVGIDLPFGSRHGEGLVNQLSRGAPVGRFAKVQEKRGTS
jgi:hypothetical protein